jgi:hypothetical protein
MTQHSGTFDCKAEFRGQTDKYVIDVTVRLKTSYVPPPFINRTMARHVRKGDAFTLVCSVTVDLNSIVELTWLTPNPKAAGDHRVQLPGNSARNLSLSGTHLKIIEQVYYMQQ